LACPARAKVLQLTPPSPNNTAEPKHHHPGWLAQPEGKLSFTGPIGASLFYDQRPLLTSRWVPLAKASANEVDVLGAAKTAHIWSAVGTSCRCSSPLAIRLNDVVAEHQLGLEGFCAGGTNEILKESIYAKLEQSSQRIL